jgi:hypothetical protein
MTGTKRFSNSILFPRYTTKPHLPRPHRGRVLLLGIAQRAVRVFRSHIASIDSLVNRCLPAYKHWVT